MMTRVSLAQALTGVDGWLGAEEAWRLHRAVATIPDPGPVRVVEIGTWKGRSTIALATAVAARPGAGIVHAVDPHRGGVAHRLLGEEDTYEEFLANLERAGVGDFVDPIRATSAAARGLVPDASVHALFVDGSHRLDDVLHDIDAWRSALRPGARVAFHDAISYPGVAAALRRRALARGSDFRRPRLVEETMILDYRPGEPWSAADSARALLIGARLAALRAARRAKSLARRPERLGGVGNGETNAAEAEGWIPFSRPYLTGNETTYVGRAIGERSLAGGGPFTARCERWLEERTGSEQAFLAKSCTAALEAAALLAGVGPGDEVVMPSFTYVSTANAFALRGATPVFVDIDPDTLTIDPQRAADAITSATKAIVAVHYAGVACDMGPLRELADRHGLLLIEDAALGLLSAYRGRPLGGIGDLAAVSFHETKNLTGGQGGALLVNSSALRERAEIIWEKGTDRRRFDRGEADRYSWIELGSAFGADEVTAAFLWAQLEQADEITRRRRAIWSRYHDSFAELERDRRLRRPVVPEHRTHNGHMYYLLLPDAEARTALIEGLAARRIRAVFHYVPLHSSPAGERHGRAGGTLANTEELSARLLRLPLWTAMGDAEVERVIDAVHGIVRAR